jgi:serine/threonine protein kinase
LWALSGTCPPEQLYGKSLPGSDIYSLGVAMLFLLTGKEPSSFHLKDMRLNYKPFVNLTGDFKHLIDNMYD